MPLESCMILLDNSQYMLNGDYTPTRLSAQIDAANLLLSHKTQSNPESTVGVIAMSGGVYSHPESVELLVSPTEDMGKIMGALHGIPVRGKGVETVEGGSGVDITASVQVASLALKHRKNKNGQQRIVIFVGSPLTTTETRLLVKAGRGLKKNNVAIDVVAMGELEENEDKLKQMVDAANGSNDAERTCHLVTIPAGVLPSDVLVGSPIVHGGGGGGGATGAGGDFPAAGAGAGAASGGGDGGGDDFAEFGGVNPNMDPELAMALRVSMEEERARQERIAREQASETAADEGSTTAQSGGEEKTEMEVEEAKEETNASSAASNAGAAATDDDLGDEDALLQQALQMSMAETQPETETTNAESAKPPAGADAPMHDEDEDEDNAMQMALQMSMQVDGGEESGGQPPQQFQDPQFVNQLLGSLPGVNPNDPALRSALENFPAPKDNDGDKEGSDKKDGDKKE